MKLGKEVKLNINNSEFKSKLGCVENYKNPDSVYIELSTWVLKNKSEELTDKYFYDFYSKINRSIKVNPIYQKYFKNVIVLFDLSKERVNKDLRTFLSLELNLTQKDELPLVSKNKSSIKNITEDLLNDLIENVFLNSNLKFFLKKSN